MPPITLYAFTMTSCMIYRGSRERRARSIDFPTNSLQFRSQSPILSGDKPTSHTVAILDILILSSIPIFSKTAVDHCFAAENKTIIKNSATSRASKSLKRVMRFLNPAQRAVSKYLPNDSKVRTRNFLDTRSHPNTKCLLREMELATEKREDIDGSLYVNVYGDSDAKVEKPRSEQPCRVQ